jgi:hypothetical protein
MLSLGFKRGENRMEKVRVRGKIEEALNGSQREGLICGLN